MALIYRAGATRPGHRAQRYSIDLDNQNAPQQLAVVNYYPVLEAGRPTRFGLILIWKGPGIWLWEMACDGEEKKLIGGFKRTWRGAHEVATRALNRGEIDRLAALRAAQKKRTALASAEWE